VTLFITSQKQKKRKEEEEEVEKEKEKKKGQSFIKATACFGTVTYKMRKQLLTKIL